MPSNFEGIDRADGAPDGIVAGEQAHLVSFQKQQLLVDEVVKDRLVRFRSIQHLGVELRPHLGAQSILLLTLRLLKLLMTDLDVADLGHRITSTSIAYVRFHAEKGERQRNQHQKDLDEFLVVANCIKHERKNPSDTFKTTNGSSPKAAMIP